MINYIEIDKKYFVFSDKDIWKYWPFDSIWCKWLFLWDKFEYDLSNLKSWKHLVWKLDNNIYLFEEENSRLKLK